MQVQHLANHSWPHHSHRLNHQPTPRINPSNPHQREREREREREIYWEHFITGLALGPGHQNIKKADDAYRVRSNPDYHRKCSKSSHLGHRLARVPGSGGGGGGASLNTDNGSRLPTYPAATNSPPRSRRRFRDSEPTNLKPQRPLSTSPIYFSRRRAFAPCQTPASRGLA